MKMKEDLEDYVAEVASLSIREAGQTPASPEAERAEEKLKEYISALPTMGEEQLYDLSITSFRLFGWRGLLLTGACGSELLKRRELRLKAGRGKNEPGKRGLQSKLKDLAEGLNVGVSTLRTNARIYETFFRGRDFSLLACENSMPREFYVIALSAPNPREAIRKARARRDEGIYTRQQFRADVWAGREPAPAAEEPSGGVKLRVTISGEANAELERLCEAGDIGEDSVIEELLLKSRQEYAKKTALRQKRSERKDAGRALLGPTDSVTR